MLTVVSTHGQAYRQGGFWKIQCRFSDGTEGTLTGQRRSVLRKRLKERGLTAEQIEKLLPQQ